MAWVVLLNFIGKPNGGERGVAFSTSSTASSVVADGLGARSGLQLNDVVLQVNGHEVNGHDTNGAGTG